MRTTGSAHDRRRDDNTEVAVAAVELMVLEFPTQEADPGVVMALTEAVRQGQVAILDLVFLARDDAGTVMVVDVDEELDARGLAGLVVSRALLLSEEDLTTIREGLAPGSSAAVVVYELTWSRPVVDAVTQAGGQVALHAQLSADAVEGALAAPAS